MIHKIIKAITGFDIAPQGVDTPQVKTDLPVRKALQTAAPLTDGIAVSIDVNGRIVDADQATSSKMPAVAILAQNGVSGQQVTCVTEGLHRAAGMNFSGFVGRALYVEASGVLGYTEATSGQIQQVATICDASGILVSIGSLQKR